MAYSRSAIVTGGTNNLGYCAALEIARQHRDWLVVVCSRSDRERAAEKINTALKQNNTVFMALDLNDTKKVRSFADEWISKNHPPIQALLLNAALQFPHEMILNSENIESTFAISHVGHALLFHLLCPRLAPNARVVVTASGVHDPLQKSGFPDATYTSGEDLAHPPPAMANRPGTGHYTNTKLANIMWVYALSKRLNERVPDRGIKVNAFDPGLMPGSGLAREYKGFMRFAWFKIFPHVSIYKAKEHHPEEYNQNGRLADLVLFTRSRRFSRSFSPLISTSRASLVHRSFGWLPPTTWPPCRGSTSKAAKRSSPASSVTTQIITMIYGSGLSSTVPRTMLRRRGSKRSSEAMSVIWM